jgi:ubiquinone/menaquinone biosynthesis C-methylase UbiE
LPTASSSARGCSRSVQGLEPAPGAGTEWLRHRVEQLVAIDLEEETVTALRQRFVDTGVEVVEGDATSMPWQDGTFDSVGSFTMLHHVPTVSLQNQLFAEALRVLRSGGATRQTLTSRNVTGDEIGTPGQISSSQWSDPSSLD